MKYILIALAGIVIIAGLIAASSHSLLPRIPGEEEPPSATKIASTTLEGGTREIFVFFPSGTLDPKMSCVKVFPVRRVVNDTPAYLKSAIEELLKGPTAEEKRAGYTTEIAPGAAIQSLLADEGDVSVDFSPSPNPGGGSCRAQAIRAEIEETLRQFPEVRHVVIASNGKTDILEP